MVSRRALLSMAASLVHLSHAIIVTQSELRDTYTYVVVGGGTAGGVVANRLSADPKNSVLLIEAGPLDKGEEAIRIPGHPGPIDPKYGWFYPGEPQTELNGRSVLAGSGKMLGGSSGVNGMLFDRGAASDYDAWGDLGNKGWGWKDLFPYFKKSENYTHADEELVERLNITYDPAAHGYDGPIHASYANSLGRIGPAFIEALNSLGLPKEEDGSGGRALNAFWAPFSQHPTNRSRSFGRTGYFDPIATRRNHHVLLETLGTRLIFDEKKGKKARVVAVEYALSNGTTISTVKVQKEVILSAGSFQSPKILQLSGIGPKPLLNRLKIPIVVDLPGVGANYQDHGNVRVFQDFKRDPPVTQEVARELYYANRTGPWIGYTLVMGFPPLQKASDRASEFLSLFKQQLSTPSKYLRPGADKTLIKGFQAQSQVLFNRLQTDLMAASEHLLSVSSCVSILNHPLSRGYVEINSTNPFAAFTVDQRFLSNPLDMHLVVDIFRFCRKITASEAVQGLEPLGPETIPGAGVESTEEVEAYIRSTYTSGGHITSTNSMMPRELGGVVDDVLKVYGVENLRVADASIIPLVPGSHTQSTCYAIGEKAADLILGRRRH